MQKIFIRYYDFFEIYFRIVLKFGQSKGREGIFVYVSRQECGDGGDVGDGDGGYFLWSFYYLLDFMRSVLKFYFCNFFNSFVGQLMLFVVYF